MLRRAVAPCVALAFLLGAGVAAHAAWPARVFAPYMYLGADDGFKLTDCDDACGQKFYTLAFIIADKNNNPAWDGRWPMEENRYADQIEQIRKRGGDVIVSFGGEAGKEIALVEPDVEKLQEKYEAILDRYHFTWLDFDIEGKALENTAANERRNTVIARLQKERPELVVSFTLPVDPNGISDESLTMLADAKARGVKVHSANVMTMDYGPRHSKGKKMSDVAISSATKAHEQCAEIDPSIQIGLTPMIGQNDVKSEVFTLDDAKALRAWADAQPWVCSLSFWASNRDNGKAGQKGGNTRSGIDQRPWDFTNIFKGFTKP